MEHCSEITSWDVYGVRRFPYRGKRKYYPGIHQTFNGSIIIQNDVFGLTIHQFEREFKACLARRKEKEQWILNIRFPDKTTKEYFEYLKYGDCTVEDQNSLGDQMLTCEFLHLRNVAGTDVDIRTRQKMFSVVDTLSKPTVCNCISTGSLAEGIDLPGSDYDVMFGLRNVTVIDDIKYLHTSRGQSVLLMEHETRCPGFCKLKLIWEGYRPLKIISRALKVTKFGIYLSTEKFMNSVTTALSSVIVESNNRHGPCISNADQDTDFAVCLRSKFWPQIGINWIYRHRSGQWPTDDIINSKVSGGCIFVPIGPKYECDEHDELLWRISFSLAEKRLALSMNYTQLLCYILLKLTLKNIIKRVESVKDAICSYFLKTTVFWLSEEIPIDTFTINKLSYCFALCIDKLMSFVRNGYCPNYFIPQHNMFLGKVDESNNKILLNILSELERDEFRIDRVLRASLGNYTLFDMNDKNTFCVNIDFQCYKQLSAVCVGSIDIGYKLLHTINLLMKSESSEFLFGVLRYYHALVNQHIAQMLVLPEHSRERSNIIRRCKKHSMDGTKTDAVSGWLLYASFYYVLGQYKKTIEIVHKVLSRFTPDMTMLGHLCYTTDDMNKYKHKTGSHLPLHHRMRQGTIRHVNYITQSTLIPKELQLEVQDGYFNVSPLILANVFFVLSKLII